MSLTQRQREALQKQQAIVEQQLVQINEKLIVMEQRQVLLNQQLALLRERKELQEQVLVSLNRARAEKEGTRQKPKEDAAESRQPLQPVLSLQRKEVRLL